MTTDTDKPRITKRLGIWYCRSATIGGSGPSPRAAYRWWRLWNDLTPLNFTVPEIPKFDLPTIDLPYTHLELDP